METTKKLPKKTTETDPIAKALRLFSARLPMTKASTKLLYLGIILLHSGLAGESLDTEDSSFQYAAIGWQVREY